MFTCRKIGKSTKYDCGTHAKVAVFVAVLFAAAAVITPWTIAACYQDCLESSTSCEGYWINGQPGGWNIISLRYNPPIAQVVWDPTARPSATPDNSFSGQVKGSGVPVYFEYADWKCACSPPKDDTEGQVPSTGGVEPEGDYYWASYNQYCNYCY